MFEAWHLPGLAGEPSFAEYRLGELDIRAPVLTAEQMRGILQHLRAARAGTLLDTPADQIVAAIDAVASILGDAHSATGKSARNLLAAATGYSSPVIEDILQHMTRDWQRSSLQKTLLLELGDARALDEAKPDAVAGRYTLARGPRLAYQIFSGNVPGVAVTSMIRCILVKAAQLGKTASGEPVLPVLFARTLADINPQLAECMGVSYWRGGSSDTEAIALAAADKVIVYGGDDAVQAISARVRDPAQLIVHGPKLSIGMVGTDATLDVAQDIAYAVAAYDQQGCVSPHVVYVERNGNVGTKQLAQAVASCLAQLAISYPRRRVDAAEANAIRAARTRFEFRASAHDESEVFAPDDTSYTVIYDEDVALQPSCLNRTLYIKPIERAQAISQLLEPMRGRLQSVALAGFSAKQAQLLSVMLAECGVSRIASFKSLPWPPMWWHHDGRGVLRELLTWHDIEADAT